MTQLPIFSVEPMDNNLNAMPVLKKASVEIGVFSGSNEASVKQGIHRMREKANTGVDEFDACKVLCSKVSPTNLCRAFVVFRGWEDFLEQTNEENLKYIDQSEGCDPNGKSVFLFPGNGIYQKKMLSLLSIATPYFHDRLKELNTIAREYYDIELLDEEVENDVVKQLRVFASELVIAEFWEKCGCKADYVIGHSMGEYAAACFAGVIDQKDAIRALVARSMILEKCSTHRMAAVETSATNLYDIAKSIDVSVEVSAFNAPELVTVSGEKDMIERLYQELKVKGVQANLINTNYGGHFSGLQTYAEEFVKTITGVRLNKPSKRIISTVYPELESDILTDLNYWSDHIFKPVKFEHALKRLPISEVSRVIDVGVTPVLLGMAMRNISSLDISWIPTVRAGRNYRQQMYRALGLAHNSGINVNWNTIYKDK